MTSKRRREADGVRVRFEFLVRNRYFDRDLLEVSIMMKTDLWISETIQDHPQLEWRRRGCE